MKKYLKCPICGKVVEVLEDSKVPVMCCGKPMEEMTANTSDGAVEKHVPVVANDNGMITISVGSTLHPMTEEHYIAWISVITNKKELFFQLKPLDEPVVHFNLDDSEEVIEVYAYCNLHGLWKC